MRFCENKQKKPPYNLGAYKINCDFVQKLRIGKGGFKTRPYKSGGADPSVALRLRSGSSLRGVCAGGIESGMDNDARKYYGLTPLIPFPNRG